MNHRIVKSTLGLTLAAFLGGALAGCSSDKGGSAANSAPPPSATATASASASVPTDTATATPTPTPSADKSAEILAAFQAKIKSGASAAELNKQLDTDLPQAAPETADEMIRELLAYYDAHLQDASPELEQQDIQQALQQMKWPITKDEIAGMKSDSARKAIQDTIDGGYKLDTSEGMIFPVVDYGKLKRFNDALSPEMRDYIALLAKESDQKSASDGGLVITWDEVANRALAAEKFIRDYPGSKERHATANLYLQYMIDLIYGLDNTPIFDFDTYKLNADVKAEYEKIVSEQAGTTTAKVVQSFLDVMKQTNDAVFKKGPGGQKVIPEVKAFREGMEKQIREDLGIANTNK